MISLYREAIYQPLYNGLIFLMDIIPWADAGVAVVLFTVIVKLALFPLSQKAIRTQQKMKQFEPELKKIKEKFKDKQEQARAMFDFYKEKKLNPFSSFFLILIQIPIVYALYSIFMSSGLPKIQEAILYSFVAVPQAVNMVFLGLIDISLKSFILALLVGITAFLQMKISMPKIDLKEKGKSFKDDLARSMSVQMKYVFPVVAALISYSISGAIALYWLTSNLFAIGQEIYIKRKIKKEDLSTNKV
ncbi:MAG: YidC/Oxa1 family membrane protein insertase [Patescibacteria group bacterium]